MLIHGRNALVRGSLLIQAKNNKVSGVWHSGRALASSAHGPRLIPQHHKKKKKKGKKKKIMVVIESSSSSGRNK